MRQDSSERALTAYLEFWRMEERRKRLSLRRRRLRLIMSLSSAAAVLILVFTFSLQYFQQRDLYIVYINGEKVVDKEFALQQMNVVMSGMPVVDQSVAEQLSSVFDGLELEE